jgi:hypothetical protein
MLKRLPFMVKIKIIARTITIAALVIITMLAGATLLLPVGVRVSAENLIGTAGVNVINGTPDADFISGLAGVIH